MGNILDLELIREDNGELKPKPKGCWNCRHWLRNEEHEKSDTGECRRYPPVPLSVVYTEFNGMTQSKRETAHPTVFEYHRCSEHTNRNIEPPPMAV